MTKVLWTHDIFSSQTYGGVSRYFSELLREFRGFPPDLSVTAFAGLHVNAHLSPGKNQVGLRVPNFPHTRFVRHGLNELWQQFYLRQKSPDLLHVTYPFRSPRAYDRPFVFTVHDMIPEIFPQYFPGGEAASSLKRAYCEQARHIIAVSTNTATDLVRLFGVEEERITVVHHGVRQPTPMASPSPKPAKPFLLFVGTLGLYKNFSVLARALAQNERLRDQFDLVVFGPENPLAHEAFQDSALAPVKSILRWSRGDDDALSFLYSNASALVYPSLYEGFGMSILEAMAHGCPVICADTPALREVAEDGAYYFHPTSTDELLAKLEECLFQPSRLASLKRNGSERVKFFSWEKTAQKTAAVYLANSPQ